MTRSRRNAIPKALGLVLPVAALSALAWSRRRGRSRTARSARPELEYLKAVNSQPPPQDPQLLFLLMPQFANANRHREGAEFFQDRLDEFDARLTERQRSLYLAAIGLLRAGAANTVPLSRRIGWVKDTIAMLEKAKRLSGGDAFVVRWMSGVVLA